MGLVTRSGLKAASAPVGGREGPRVAGEGRRSSTMLHANPATSALFVTDEDRRRRK